MTLIACLSPYSADQVRALAGTSDIDVRLAPAPPDPEAVRAAVPDADIIISDQRHKHRLDRETLASLKHCRLIQQPAVGYDAIDHVAAAEFGIPLANAGGYNSDTVADWVVMGILNLLRFGAWHDRNLRNGSWRLATAQPRELGALTVGIIGMGNIGRAITRRLVAFGSPVIYADVVRRADVPGAREAGFHEVLERSDIVSVHVPLSEATRGLIGDDEFKRMRTDAILVNASRGPVVDEPALIRALDAGAIAAAALDVFEGEPLSEDSPLRQMDSVFMTPHIAGDTRESRARMLGVVGDNIRRALAGRSLLNVVNGVPAGGGPTTEGTTT
ncbi:MAG: 2-hydroxyacid dehydrogenase [Mycobacteriales bacterium]